MPISKHFSSGSPDPRVGRRRPRLEITREMISAPLGDFRHTMHVGRGGDAFGDTSFLRERPAESPRRRRGESPPPAAAAGREGLLARTLRASKRSLSVGRSSRLSSTSTSSFVAVPVPSPSSAASPASAPSFPPVVAVSPQLSQSEIEVQCLTPPHGQRPGHSAQLLQTPMIPVGSFTGVTVGFTAGLDPYSGGGATARPNGAAGGQEPRSDRHDESLARSVPALKHAESVMSFHVDLGPSMLGDVLGVMGSEDGAAAAPGDGAAAPSAGAPPPGRGGSGRGGSRGSSASSGGSSATLADDAASQDDGEGDGGGAWGVARSETLPAARAAALPAVPFTASLHHHQRRHHHHPLGSYLDDDEILPF